MSVQPIEKQQRRSFPFVMQRFALWLSNRFRPYLDWPVFITCLLIALLPAIAFAESDWIERQHTAYSMRWLGPSMLLLTWLLLGWKAERATHRYQILQKVAIAFGLLLGGIALLTQLLVGWFPNLWALVAILYRGNWPALVEQVSGGWLRLAERFLFWWQGVQSGGATQDDLILSAAVGILFWFVAILTAWLARKKKEGLLASIPALWLLGIALLYGPTARSTFLGGLALALVLYLLLDQQQRVERWQAQNWGYSQSLFLDRAFATIAVGAVIFAVAAITPSLSIDAISERYFQLISPVDREVDQVRERLFPELKGTSRRGAGTVQGGLPNEFLLGSGPELSQLQVMRLRTNESSPFEFEEPPSHYMRNATLSRYDGLGWGNPSPTQRLKVAANQRWQDIPLEGRKLLLQTVQLSFNSSILYAAGEPLEPALDYTAEIRSDGDLVAIRAGDNSYTVVSAVPAVDEEMLAAIPGWGAEEPLPEALQIHLALPETITDRTRELAQELTGNSDTPFAKAHAIESFLRSYPYDLEISEPPPDVTDVADFFLFDLKRGYCDYYTTAFVVLARLSGLPTRFANGFAKGYWNERDGSWTITEAQAHSWPEVYFPQYGWIPFEPTAGRPTLQRVAVAQFEAIASSPLPSLEEPAPAPTLNWNWQMLFWLLPLAALLWFGYQQLQLWLQRRTDPWQSLLRWGRRVGRPIAEGETVFEYGRALAQYVAEHPTNQLEHRRLIAREIEALSNVISEVQYGAEEGREGVVKNVHERWQRLRGYLR